MNRILAVFAAIVRVQNIASAIVANASFRSDGVA